MDLGSKKVTVLSCYRPPDMKMDETFYDLDLIFKEIDVQNCLIVGDFNVCLNKKNSFSMKYLDKVFVNNMEQIVHSSSRFTSNCASLIDHVITNMNNTKAFVTYHSLSDHLVILCVFDRVINKTEKNIDKRNVDKIHYSKSLDNIKKFDWMKWISEHELSDIDTAYDSFHNINQEKTVFESKRINKKRTPICPWMDKTLLNKKRQMEIARKKFLRRNNAVNETKYRALKKEYNNSIQKAKYNYYGKELFRSSKDSKKLWSVINTIIAKKSVTEPVRTIKHNDLVLKDDTEIAEVFAEFYKHSALEKTKDIVSNVEFSSFLSGKKNHIFTQK